MITLIACLSQNLIPIHIAYIPILIPPMLVLMNKMRLDRRAVACCLAFGHKAPYIAIPFGFGLIFQTIISDNLTANGMEVTVNDVAKVNWVLAVAMIIGLLIAVFVLYRKPRDYQKEKLESLIEEFRLQKVRKNLGDRLSGGERRRTEIARCLAIDPKFIMLDEPFAGVDPTAVEDIQLIVWKLKQRNIGVLITDHNVQETLCITDRAYLLFEGQILFEGTPQELAVNPVVLDKYLTRSFELRMKDFKKMEEERARE